MPRLCTAAEVKFYGASLMQIAEESSEAKSSNYLKPNKNCNLSSWVSGCEPGWACSVGKDKQVDLKNSKDIPYRLLNCRPCCEGFFCPHGLTCMIREFLPNLSIIDFQNRSSSDVHQHCCFQNIDWGVLWIVFLEKHIRSRYFFW